MAIFLLIYLLMTQKLSGELELIFISLFGCPYFVPSILLKKN